MRAPLVIQFDTEVFRDQFGDFVFETLAALIGEGEIVRIGRYPEDTLGGRGPRVLFPRATIVLSKDCTGRRQHIRDDKPGQ